MSEPAEQDIFDTRFICEICHGSGKVKKRMKGGQGVEVNCRKCQGSGMFATGNPLKGLLRRIKGLEQQRGNEFTHVTALQELVTVRLTEVGVDLFSPTGYFMYITAGNNHLTVAVKPKGTPRVDEWDITHHLRKQSEETNDKNESD